MVILRGHHLICLHFYHGEGLTAQYRTNLSQVVARAADGEQIQVSAGADDICQACPFMIKGRCTENLQAEQEITELDNLALNVLNFRAGDIVSWRNIKNMVDAISPEWFDIFCQECEWEKFCER